MTCRCNARNLLLQLQNKPSLISCDMTRWCSVMVKTLEWLSGGGMNKGRLTNKHKQVVLCLETSAHSQQRYDAVTCNAAASSAHLWTGFGHMWFALLLTSCAHPWDIFVHNYKIIIFQETLHHEWKTLWKSSCQDVPSHRQQCMVCVGSSDRSASMISITLPVSLIFSSKL